MNRDIAKLDTRLLMAFDALLSERNVTRAAEHVGLTQQGLSGQLARLRDLFDDPLFVRSKGGILPTPRAEALAPLVSRALESLEPLVSPISFDPRSFDGTVNIAASDYALALIMPPLLDRIRTAAPGMRLMVRPADHESLDVEMRDGTLDLALTVPQFVPPGLQSLHLFEERYVGVARSDHPVLSGSDVSLDAFCAHPQVLVSPFRGDASGPTDAALAAVGRRRSIALVVPGFSVVGSLIERTDLIAVLPERLVHTMNRKIQIFEPPVPIPGFSLQIYWPRRLDTSKLHVWLRREISDAASAT